MVPGSYNIYSKRSMLFINAEVAELVDALGSGSSVRTDIGVRVPASAPLIIKALENF